HLRNQRCKNSNPSARIRAGVLWQSCECHPGISTPESLRGFILWMNLTLGITRGARAPVGLHRFEPVEWNGITSAPGNSITRQGISLSFVTTIHIEGLVISANLCMSPCSSDSIFTHLHHECLAYSL